jgi:sodium transport system permease protein
MALWPVLVKELLEGLRDRRSLVPLLLAPLIGPLVLGLALTQVIQKTAPGAHLDLPVVGAEHAPGLVAELERDGIAIAAAPDDPFESVRSGSVPLVLVIPEGYARRFREANTATVELLVDSARTDTARARARVLTVIRAHAQVLGRQRLLARGTAPSVAEPIAVQEVDVATPRKHAALFLEMLPMFVLIASFVGGAQIASDTTAGERERGSLEPLLITPVPRRALVAGKWMIAAAFSAVAAMLTTISLTALRLVPAERIGLSFALSATEIASAIAAVLPLSLFFSAAQILVSSVSRTVREAQTYLSLSILLPVIPSLLVSTAMIKLATWMTAVPILGQSVLFASIIRGEPMPAFAYLLSAASTAACALSFVELTAWLFRRERIIYGR